MQFVSNWLERLGPASYVVHAIVASAIGMALLLGFILWRRAYRRSQIRQRGERTLALRKQWEGILDGRIRAETWRFDPLDRDIVESILLDRLEVAPPPECERLLKCLRFSGLLDMRIYEARQQRGWRRRQALVCLGRMHAPEGIPALAEGLEDPNPKARLSAVRGLGNVGLPEAAVPILDHVVRGQLRIPILPVQNALLSCCRSRPSLLLSYVLHADDSVRPLLARVLGEVASPELGEELLLLASDPLPEVRASAARALAEVGPPLALTALANLVRDEEWFVRLRAVVALGRLEDPRTIPSLVEGLCDSNRHVRLRAAWALARLDAHLEEILELVMDRQDRYALQALVSELERSGVILELVDSLTDPARRAAAERILLVVLRAGAQRLLLDALVRHGYWRVRLAVARLLARSGESQLIPQLEQLAAATMSRRQQRITRWLLGQLRVESAPGSRPHGVRV